jgi:hypothetical protein
MVKNKKMMNGIAWVTLNQYAKLERAYGRLERKVASLREDGLSVSALARSMIRERDDAIRLRNEAQVKLVEVEKKLDEMTARANAAEPLANEARSDKRRIDNLEANAKSLRKALKETRDALVQKHVLVQTAMRIVSRYIESTDDVQSSFLKARIIERLRGYDTDVAKTIVSMWDPDARHFAVEKAIWAVVGEKPTTGEDEKKAVEILRMFDELRDMEDKMSKRKDQAARSAAALVDEALAVDMPARSVSDGEHSTWGAANVWMLGLGAMAAGLVSQHLVSKYAKK